MAHMNNKPPALPQEVPPLVADFVNRALDKDPARRQPSAGDFGRTALALAATLRGTGTDTDSDAAAAAHPSTKVLTAAAPVAASTPDDERERRRIRNIFIAVGAAVVLVG